MTTTNRNRHLNALMSGSESGLRNLYAEFLPRITRFITSNGGTRDDAKDTFQDALMIIYQKANEEDFKLTSEFYTLLYGICRKVWRNRLRKKTGQEVTFSEVMTLKVFDEIEEQIVREEKGKLFWSAFRKLGKDCQKIMTLFFEKKKMEEITELMGFGSVSYTKKRKFQCKERLIKLAKSDSRYEELKW